MFQLQLFFLLHCDEWDHVVALPRHKFVTGATLLQLGKVCTQMGSGQPIVCTTSDFHAVLFWFVYDTSAVRRPTLTIGVSMERKIT
jgi:hypothetical protein